MPGLYQRKCNFAVYQSHIEQYDMRSVTGQIPGAGMPLTGLRRVRVIRLLASAARAGHADHPRPSLSQLCRESVPTPRHSGVCETLICEISGVRGIPATYLSPMVGPMRQRGSQGRFQRPAGPVLTRQPGLASPKRP
jgi:hypothetical protein